MVLNIPSIEFPSEPIPFEEGLAADREVIAAKRALADTLDSLKLGELPGPHILNFTTHCPPTMPMSPQVDGAVATLAVRKVADCYTRLLRAEARAQEIAIHNNLFQIGKVQRAQLIATPNLGGRIA